MQQEPNQPSITQPSQKLVDEKIAAITNEVYSFEHEKTKRSLRERFKALPRTRQMVVVIGSCFVIFTIVVAGVTLMSASRNKTDSTKVATSAGGTSKDNLAEYQTGDVNGDGIIDQYDVNASSADAGDSTSSNDSEVSWWQKILNTGEGSPYPTTYSTTNVAYESSPTYASSDDNSSAYQGDGLDYLDDGDTSYDGDYDNSGWIDIPITDGPTGGTTVPAGGATVTFASWNTLYSNSVSNVGKGAAAVGSKADVIGFQELHLSDRRKKMRDTLLCSSCAFSGYVQNYSTNGSNPGSVSIAWRKDRFSVVTSGYYKVSDTEYISTKTGSTGNKISAKWITWVLLKDKSTGAQFYFLNTHTVASLESKGKPIGSEDDRVKNYTHHMDVLTSKINAFKASGYPVFITGDFNVNYRYDHKVQYKNFPFARLGAIGVHSDYQRLNLAGIPQSQASQGDGNRIIDYVWYSNSTNVYPVSESISTARYGSDHYPVYFTANVR